MPIAGFDEFRAGFAELMGIDVGIPELDEFNALAFTVEIQSIPLSAVHVPQRPDAVFLMAELAPLPEGTGTDPWCTALAANMDLMGHDTPVFSCDPESGNLLVQCAVLFEEVSIAEACERAQSLIEVAKLWNSGLQTAQETTESEGGLPRVIDGMFA